MIILPNKLSFLVATKIGYGISLVASLRTHLQFYTNPRTKGKDCSATDLSSWMLDARYLMPDAV